MRLKTYINGIEGVAVGGIAVGNVPINRRYHALKAFVGATISGSPSTDPTAILDYVRLIVNGVVIRDVTPAQLLAIADLNGQTVGAGELPMWFSEPWRASVLGEEATSWDMFGQTKFVAEFKFKSGITAPSLKLLASYDYARNVNGDKPFLSIVKQLSQTYNAPSGKYDITTLNINWPIQRILLQASTGNVTAAEVYRDSELVHEATSGENARFLADYGLDGTAFSYPIVFDYDQQISSPLVVEKDLNVRATSSASNQLNVLVEQRAPGYV